MNQEKAENEDQMIDIKRGKDKLWAKDKVKFDITNITNAFIDLSNNWIPLGNF